MTDYSIDYTKRNEEIYQLRLKHVILKDIAKQYGISSTRVSMITYKLWRAKGKPAEHAKAIVPYSSWLRERQ